MNMPVSADGILRRLGQGKTLRSAMFRAVTRGQPYVAYWPLEDPDGATRAVSGLTGASPMSVTGPVQFGQSGPPGSDGAVNFADGGGRLSGVVAGMPASARGWLVSAWIDLPNRTTPRRRSSRQPVDGRGGRRGLRARAPRRGQRAASRRRRGTS